MPPFSAGKASHLSGICLVPYIKTLGCLNNASFVTEGCIRGSFTLIKQRAFGA